MAFINGLEISDATGRAFVDLNAALPVPPGKSALGGMLYNNVGGIGRVQVDDSLSPAPFSVNDGYLYNANGQLCILQSLPGGAPLFNNGIRVNQAGAIAISAGGPIANWVHGWPVTIDGALCIDTGAPAVTVVTWNPADKGANTTLSGGNLIATGTAVGTGPFNVRANVGRNTGKYYFEVVYTTVGATGLLAGLCDGTAPTTATLSQTDTTDDFATCNANNSFFRKSTFTSMGAVLAAGDVLGVAIDLTTGKNWFAKNNVWILSGNPAAGTNPAQTIATGVTYYPVARPIQASVFTGRFASAALQFAPPAGFSPWESASLRSFSEAFAEGFA